MSIRFHMGGDCWVAFYESREVIALVMQIPRVQTFANRLGLASFTSVEGAHNNRPGAWSSEAEWVWRSP